MPTALIVEDEPEANELLAMVVQLRGYRTESAFNGAEAAIEAADFRAMLAMDRNFHRAVALATGNSTLARFVAWYRDYHGIAEGG